MSEFVMESVALAAEVAEFGATGEGIVWAVIDSGIDGRHPHFRRHANLELPPPLRHRDLTGPKLEEATEELEALVDVHGNGTFAAGLIAGELAPSSALSLRIRQRVDGDTSQNRRSLSAASGIAPRCRVVSFKVLDDVGSGRMSAILRALSLIEAVNGQAGHLLVHGINLGLSFDYDRELFACGYSPLCAAVNRVVESGVVVVASAGNAGSATVSAAGRTVNVGAFMSISDPGNAEQAITVGSTHLRPEAYGVSYFSSRGPTADGRQKPDLVAPGERMISTTPGRRSHERPSTAEAREAHYIEQTGTSVAAAFVSGAIAALLSARRELIGQPMEVKRLLAGTAQDLQRDRYSQGFGAVSLRRALEQSGRRGSRAAAQPAGAHPQIPAASAEPEPAARPTEPTPTSDGSKTDPSSTEGKRFAIGLSYPGERRGYVQKVVQELRQTFSREEIFYDRFHQAELVGRDLDTRLERIYGEESELLVVFVSREYAEKEWTGLEWRVVRDVMKRRRAEDVVPMRFDDTPIPGLLSIDAYVDLSRLDPEFAAALIVDRLALNRESRREE